MACLTLSLLAEDLGYGPQLIRLTDHDSVVYFLVVVVLILTICLPRFVTELYDLGFLDIYPIIWLPVLLGERCVERCQNYRLSLDVLGRLRYRMDVIEILGDLLLRRAGTDFVVFSESNLCQEPLWLVAPVGWLRQCLDFFEFGLAVYLHLLWAAFEPWVLGDLIGI